MFFVYGVGLMTFGASRCSDMRSFSFWFYQVDESQAG